VVAGHSEQFTSSGYLSTVKHTALGIEPTTFRLSVRRATSRATETIKMMINDEKMLQRKC